MKNSCYKKTFVLGIIFLFVGAGVIPSLGGTVVEKKSTVVTSSGNTLYVGGSGPNNYSTIRSAINDADHGDTVFVYGGQYDEYDLFIHKSINLIGFSKYSVIINGDEGDEDVITVTSNNVLIQNFTIIGTQGYQIGDSCIRIESINNVIKDNILRDSHSGILIFGDNHQNDGPNYIKNCAFYDNFATGVFIENSKDCTVENCDFYNSNWGVYILFSTYNKILNCKFDESLIWLASGEYNLIENCELSNRGIVFNSAQDGNIIKNCRIDRGYDGIAYFSSGWDNIVQDCVITNCRREGIYLSDYGLHNNFKVINCTIEKNAKNGIYFREDINDCIISNCRFLNNTNAGIKFVWQLTRRIKVYDCHFENNEYGILFYDSTLKGSNRFHHNNFISNADNFEYTESQSPFANNEFEENHWDDYNGTDSDGDGIGDTPYIVGGWDKDNYPLMEPLGFDPDAPSAPNINGPASGKPRVEYDYMFVATDPNGDDVYYYITWGDGTYEGWIGPYASGEMVTLKHTWNEKDTYPIIARAKDTNGLIGPWGLLQVKMPRNRATYNSLFLQFLERFPLLEKLLDILGGLMV